ncbi:MAG TPA: hypothetical protein VI072_02930 [Polyangiaceae bacterium]
MRYEGRLSSQRFLMLVPVAVAVSSVAAGALLALLPAGAVRALGPVRTFALTASVTVVLVHLLPEALEALGALALVVFGCALLLPNALHSVGERMRRSATASAPGRPSLALEIAYAGLLVHQLADGIGLGTYGDPAHGGHEHHHVHADVLVAIAAHTVPIVAAVVLGMQAAYGRRVALIRALVLALATCAGVLITELVPNEIMAHASGWIAAAAAGLLLHVVTHAIPRVPANFVSRAADFGGAACGIALALVGAELPALADGAAVRRTFGIALYELTLDSAPLLLVGFLCAALLQALTANVKRPSAVSSALFGATLGAEASLLSAGFLGWSFAALLWLGGVVVAVLVSAGGSDVRCGSRALCVEPPLTGRKTVNLVDALLELRGPWMVLGLLAAAFAESAVTGTIFSANAPLLQVAGCVALAGLAAAYLPAAVVLGSVLVSKGLAPALLLAALLVGPQLASAGAGRKGSRLTALLGALLASAGAAWAFWQLARVRLHAHDLGITHAYAWPTYAATAVLLALLVQKIWRVGTAVWMSELWAFPGCAKAPHADASACGAVTPDTLP